VSPTSWSWTFPGGTPATSTSTEPNSNLHSTAGTYTVTLTATNTLGSDGETKTNYITVAAPTGTALPLVQTFESTTFPPTGWTLTSSSGFNWERTTTASGFGTSTASMKFNNSANNANKLKDDINSPTLSIGTVTNPRVKFDIAYAPYIDGVDDTYDTIEVLIKDICAGTTTSIYKKGGVQLQTATGLSSEFVPTANQWRKDSVNIPGTFSNKYVQVIFRNYGLWGNSVYVDNINVYGTVVTGTPTASFTASDTTVCSGNNLVFTNTSTSGNTTSVDSVRWTINGGIPSTSTSLTNVTATFNTAGTYIISLKAYEGGVGSTVFTKSIRVKPSTNSSCNNRCYFSMRWFNNNI
jgi:PKD repeat protein